VFVDVYLRNQTCQRDRWPPHSGRRSAWSLKKVEVWTGKRWDDDHGSVRLPSL